MPTHLSAIPGRNRKKLRLLALLILSPVILHAQTLTGLWIGEISNDSSTVRKDQSFEIALTEYRGKVYGYSRSEFIVDDVLYFIVKRVKGTIEGDVCEVEDDDIIAYNFPGKLDKKVRVTSTFRRNGSDSTWYLDGTWKTNTTRNYYSLTGKITLEEEKDLTASKIFPHLEELKLANDVAFYKDRIQGAPIVRIARPEKTNSVYGSPPKDLMNSTPDIAVSKPAIQRAEPGPSVTSSEPEEKMPEPIEANTVAKETISNTRIHNSSTTKPNPALNTNHAPATARLTPKEEIVVSKTETQQIPASQTHTVNSADPVGVNRSENPDDKRTVKTNIPATQTVSAPQTQQRSEPDPYENWDRAVIKKENPAQPLANKPTNNSPGQNVSNTSPVKSVAEQNTSKTASNKKIISVDQSRSDASPNAASNRDNKQNSSPIPVASSIAGTTSAIAEKKESRQESITAPVIAPVVTSVVERNGAAQFVNERKTEVSQIVNFRSDSLQLALYDNGQIDGDTVSILMNGQLIMAKQGLKASAIRKTIYLPQGSDQEFSLVLYAENLGAFPPNTGLLVVRDGDEVYNLRFSSDFQKNTGIVFRRKK